MAQFSTTSDELCRDMARQNKTVLLAFSGGKDAICSWLQLSRYFERIVPVYYYLIPDLEFVEKGLRYYENYFNTPIIRQPHISLLRWLCNLTFQAPENTSLIFNSNLFECEYEDINNDVRKSLGLSPETYCATGVRAVDGPMRMTAIKKHGPVSHDRKTFFPIFDWNKARVVSELQQANLRLPAEYKYFGRSFDGLDYRFVYHIKQHYPADYAKILEFFPLVEAAIKRVEYREAYYARHKLKVVN